MRSSVLVAVPEAEPVVGEWRRRYTLDAPAGIPAHVTILFPFVAPAQLTEVVEGRLAELVVGTAAFELTFTRTARWPGILYLEPEPAEPFVALTNALEREWPDHPPYGGAHETIVPHLTVAESEDAPLLDRITAEVEPQLPIASRVREASVFVEDEAGHWHEHGRLPLAQSGVA
ncbi:MAG TPA: 2'-5' RNA ligase family protein [Gaiellaceae bacterium]|nr:2'-5' RNA ligase family protein [Gaiellaceae bacterium]